MNVDGYYEESARIDGLESIEIQDIDQCTVEVVSLWYKESEKLIKIYADTFHEAPFPSINQLRYAGHHLSRYLDSDCENRSDLIDSYKHCKRSVFDLLDSFAIRLQKYAENFRYNHIIGDEDYCRLSSSVKDLVQSINFARVETNSRVEFYQIYYDKFSKFTELKYEFDRCSKPVDPQYLSAIETEAFRTEVEQFKLKLSRDSKLANFAVISAAIAAFGSAIPSILKLLLLFWNKIESLIDSATVAV